MDAWHPIDTAPRDGTRVLLWDDKRDIAVSGVWWYEPTMNTPNGYEPGWEGWSCDEDLIIWDDPDDQPTHWMPLQRPRTSKNHRHPSFTSQHG